MLHPPSLHPHRLHLVLALMMRRFYLILAMGKLARSPYILRAGVDLQRSFHPPFALDVLASFLIPTLSAALLDSFIRGEAGWWIAGHTSSTFTSSSKPGEGSLNSAMTFQVFLDIYEFSFG
jgi:hypothetical protein